MACIEELVPKRTPSQSSLDSCAQSNNQAPISHTGQTNLYHCEKCTFTDEEEAINYKMIGLIALLTI